MTPTPVRSITQAMRHVRRGEAVHAEGIGGSLIVEPTEPYWWRCSYTGVGIAVLKCCFTAVEVHDWLRQYFPRLMGRDPRGDHRRNAGERVSYEGRRRLSAPAAKTRCRHK